MKDAQGHGSDSRGSDDAGMTKLRQDLDAYAAHQKGVLSAVPSVEGRSLYDDLVTRPGSGVPNSGWSDADLRGYGGG